MSTHYHYFVHANEDPDSPIIFEGTSVRICSRFNTTARYLSKMFAVNRPILKDRYLVTRVSLREYEENHQKELRTKRKKSKFQKNLEMVERMLDRYGNTIIYKDRDKVVSRLEGDGYFVKDTHEPRRVIHNSSLGEHKGEVYPECWILELVRKETINNV